MSAQAVDLLAGAVAAAAWVALAGPLERDLRPALVVVAAGLIVALTALLTIMAEAISALCH